MFVFTQYIVIFLILTIIAFLLIITITSIVSMIKIGKDYLIILNTLLLIKVNCVFLYKSGVNFGTYYLNTDKYILTYVRNQYKFILIEIDKTTQFFSHIKIYNLKDDRWILSKIDTTIPCILTQLKRDLIMNRIKNKIDKGEIKTISDSNFIDSYINSEIRDSKIKKILG
jgi:hypothetical protein